VEAFLVQKSGLNQNGPNRLFLVQRRSSGDSEPKVGSAKIAYVAEEKNKAAREIFVGALP
jgi:hypothetical protein